MKIDKYGPHPETLEELMEYIKSQDHDQHSYESVADATTNVALATFNYFARSQGITGFQASWASMVFLGKSRGMEGPFAIVRAEDLVYPQYDLRAKLEEYIAEWMPWAAAEAKKKLSENKPELVHPDVWDHWQKLADTLPKDEPEVK